MGSYVNDGERIQYDCEDELDKPGLVVTQTDAAVAGDVKLVDADKEKPAGVALMSTEDPLNKNTYLSDVEITTIRTGAVECILASDNAEIVRGDAIMAVKDGANKEGVVDKLTIRVDNIANYSADMIALLGFAEEAKAVNIGATYGTKIKVRLALQRT